jgi:trans-aconitate 2-methyltransferase
MAWDPKTYLAFGAERTRPASDLLARIPLETPKRVADLGCGPGNSTALLRARWPDAEIVGIDSSPEMLREARASGAAARFIESDIASWMPDEPYDVIFSNAVLQWLGDHETLVPRLFSLVKPGGVFAFQIPRNYDEVCQVLVREAAADPRWAAQLQSARDWWNGLVPERYYDLIALEAQAIDLLRPFSPHQTRKHFWSITADCWPRLTGRAPTARPFTGFSGCFWSPTSNLILPVCNVAFSRLTRFCRVLMRILLEHLQKCNKDLRRDLGIFGASTKEAING